MTLTDNEVAELDELLTEYEYTLRSKIQREFDHSDSITPGLWERLEAEQEPQFQRIRTCRAFLRGFGKL
jgi:hypothetical protein